MRSFVSSLLKTGRMFGVQRMLWLPFLVAGFAEVLFLVLSWLAPHPPFSSPLAHRPLSLAPKLLSQCSLLVLVAAIAGCSASYDGERLFWKAEQLSAPIVKEPSQAGAERAAVAIDAFERVIARVPETLWAARAHLAIGSLYAIQADYRSARDAYAMGLKSCQEEPRVCLTARYAIAKTYEVEERVDEMVQAYEEIANQHPFTKVGIRVPLLIGQIYDKREEPDRAVEAFRRAKRRYTRLAFHAPTPELQVEVKGYLALTHQQLGEWERAAELLETLVDAGGANRPFVLLSLGSIYDQHMRQSERAEETSTALIQEFPEHPFSNTATMRLEHLHFGMVSTTSEIKTAPAAASMAVR